MNAGLRNLIGAVLLILTVGLTSCLASIEAVSAAPPAVRDATRT